MTAQASPLAYFFTLLACLCCFVNPRTSLRYAAASSNTRVHPAAMSTSAGRESLSLSLAGSEEGEELVDRATPPRARLGAKKAALLLLLLGAIVFLIVDYTGAGYINEALTAFLDWTEDNIVAGTFAFAGVYVVCTVLFIPGSLLTLGAGYVFSRAVGQGWGILLGTLSVWVGATIGACLAFLLGRFVLRDAAMAWYEKFRIMRAVDRAVARQGLKVVTLLRLSPVVPFSPLNYVLGLTSVSFRDYALATTWGIVPGTLAFVFIGSTVSSVGDPGDGSGGSGGAKVAVYIVGALATLAAVVLISRYAKKALNEALAEDDDDDDDQDEVAVAVGGVGEEQAPTQAPSLVGGQEPPPSGLVAADATPGAGSG